MKLCKDCKHVRAHSGYTDRNRIDENAMCAATGEVNLVTGAPNMMFCESMRLMGKCGKDAKLFEPKEPA